MTSISSSSSSSSSFFTQFRIYCSSLERDAKKLRKSVEAVKTGGPSAVSSISLSGSEQDDAESYLDNIEDSCKMYEQKMLDIDQRIHGSLDNRLSLINSKEILEKCTKLYEANQLMMTKLDEYISKFDANKKPLVATATAGLKLKHAQAVNNIENQENIININTNEIDTITTIDNDDNVNEEEAAHDLTTNGSTLCDGIENDEDDLESESCHEEVEGGDIGDISVKVDDIVLSPVASRSSEKIVDNKTPTLLDWKLSDATRKIVNIKGTVSPQNNSYNDDDIIETWIRISAVMIGHAYKYFPGVDYIQFIKVDLAKYNHRRALAFEAVDGFYFQFAFGPSRIAICVTHGAADSLATCVT
jgi:hypothetical protein